jgi:hypothetical protein
MIVGITGHQNLSGYEQVWIKHSLLTFISTYRLTKGYSSLAIGADQLFVKCLLENKIKYDVILPCDNYEKTFENGRDLTDFYFLLNSANEIIKLDFKEPSELAFYQAGILVVELSDTIIAVWDGLPAKGLGGTGDIVKISKERGKRVFHINPVRQTKQFI